MKSAALKKALYTSAFLLPWLRKQRLPALLLLPRFRKRYIPVPLLFWTLLTAATVLAATEIAEVRHVLDGDTVILRNNQHLRLIGINAPELGKDGAPDQPLATRARDRLAQLVRGQRVTLGFERERRDHYNRLLAHVYLPDGRDVEEILLHEGLAWAVAVPPNVGKLPALISAENEARGTGRGIWGEPVYAPTPAERVTPQDAGFRFIEGTILRYQSHRKLIYFDLSPRVALVVAREDWKKYHRGKPADWVGHRVVARGWLTDSQGRLHLRVPHPAMLTWRD
ncbi:MAG: thermonuclease family protein [Pseudomonadota bacterium]